MSKSNLLETTISPGSIWEIKDDGFLVYENYRERTAGNARFVSDAELTKLHSNLPAGIRLLEPHLRQQQVTDTLGVFIRRMLAIWNTNMLVESTSGSKVALLSVNSISLTTRYARFSSSGFCYDEVADPATGQNLRLPMNSSPATTTVPREWLDAHYPGWSKRYAIAKALDVDEAAAIASIYSPTQGYEPNEIPTDLTL